MKIQLEEGKYYHKFLELQKASKLSTDELITEIFKAGLKVYYENQKTAE